MNELDFIKHEFLKDANPFSVFRGDSEINRAANIFQYKFSGYIEKIKNATSIDEVKDYVNKSCEDFGKLLLMKRELLFPQRKIISNKLFFLLI